MRTIGSACVRAVVALLVFQLGAQARNRGEEIGGLLRAVRSRAAFNGAILVAERGRIVFEEARVEADFARQTPLRTNSAFELASVSKPFTATASMLLAERGKLSYDDPIAKYLPEVPYPGVTIRHLLTHTSGLPDPEQLLSGDWPSGKVAKNADVVARLAALRPPAFFAPGERWRYNGTAYFLLARIVEKVSGLPFGRFLETNVFRPLGMRDSFVAGERTGRLARGYMRPTTWSDEYALSDTVPRYSYVTAFGDTSGAKGVYSSAEDLFKWVRALNGGRLVKRATLDEAYTPAKLNDGTTPSAGGGGGNGRMSSYGFGWFIQSGPDGKTVRHTGDWPGYITCLIHNVDRDQTIVVLTNTGDVSAIEIANAIENLLNRHPYTLPRLSIAREVARTILSRGVEAGVARYHELKTGRPDDYDFASESELNRLGYELLRHEKKPEALAVFELNVDAFPESWNVHDSLAEAYLAVGDRERAIESYRRSVELNPESRSGIEALKRLGAP